MNQGDTMKPTEQNTKKPFVVTGCFALLRGLLHTRGTGASPSTLQGVGGRRLAVLALVFALTLIVPASASASFTRPFLGQITGTPSAPFALTQNPTPPPPYVQRRGPHGVALDGEGNLWVGDELEEIRKGEPPQGSFQLDEFSPAYAAKPNAFLQTLSVGESAGATIASATTNDFYDIVANPNPELGNAKSLTYQGIEVLSSTGSHVETWSDEFVQAHVAIDNSTEPLKDPSACGTLPLLSSSECFVYVYNGGEHGDYGSGAAIEKLSSNGTPVEYADAKNCKSEGEKCGYIEGYKITGLPHGTGCLEGASGKFADSNGASSNAITVDSEGNIYAAYPRCDRVLEYKPNGEYLKDFSLEELPGLGSVDALGLNGVAFDPVSGHLLASAAGGVSGSAEDLGVIYEFEAMTGKYVSRTTETAAGTPLHKPTEMVVDSHGDLYVQDGGAVDAYGSGLYKPTLTLGRAGERKPQSAVLNGTVNPEGLKLTSCDFEYVTEAAFNEVNPVTHAKEGFAKAKLAECEPPPAGIPTTGVTPVKAEASPLIPGTAYLYRLDATSEGALGGTSHTEPLAFTAPAAPEVVSTSAANLSSTYADLHAQIDPHGAATTYRFEYLTAAAYRADGESFLGPDPATSVPVPDASLGSGGPTGSAVEGVLQHVGPLAPNNTYYYRVVAENAQGVTSGGVCEGEPGLRPACTFVTLPAAVPGLPDGRSYELVTPATKEGGTDMFAKPETNGIFSNNDVGTPSESGDGFLLEAESGFGPFPAAFGGAYVFARDQGKGEWTYKSLASPSLGAQTIGVFGSRGVVFDPADLSRVGVNDTSGSGVSEEGARELSLLGEPGGPYTTLHADPVFHGIFAQLNLAEYTEIVGSSRDLSHVVLESEVPRESTVAAGRKDEACPGSEGVKNGAALCEWTGGQLKLIDVNSEGELISACGATLGAPGGGGTHQAVSADGSRVFFTAPDLGLGGLSGPGCWHESYSSPYGTPGGNAPQVYARIGGTSTLEVSKPEPNVKEPGSPGERPVPYPAEFVGASEDGSKVFFVTETWLTANHPQGHDPELYECEIVQEAAGAKCRLTRISAGEKGEPGESEGTDVFGVQAVASEGSAVYFLAFGKLAEGASTLAEPTSQSGGPVNLYRYQTETPTTPARTTYVATVSTVLRSNQPDCDGVEGFAPCTEENWYTTPDGRYLLFYSEADLTSNAHTGGNCYVPARQNNNSSCGVLYRYDAQAAEKDEQAIVCVSCDPNGGVTTGNAEFARSASRIQPASPVRAMSNDGSYVFFDTPTPLLPQATNGTLDVYEWHAGTISLLSSGSEAGPSYFLGYSPYVTPGGETVEGANVFIGTHDKLVAADTNSVGNIYDARICVAESPCIQPPPGETVLCEGASCQSPPAEPLDATPTSLTFSGPGDVSSGAPPSTKTVTTKTTPKCKSGYVRKKVKKKEQCVKKAKPKKAKKSNHGRAK
jgi:hypothetical protein